MSLWRSATGLLHSQAPENTTVPKAFHHMHPAILLKIQPRTLMGYFRTLDPTDFLRAQGAR